MKQGWKTEPFEECIEKVTCAQKIKRKDFLDDGSHPIVSQEEAFINGYWNNEADLFKGYDTHRYIRRPHKGSEIRRLRFCGRR